MFMCFVVCGGQRTACEGQFSSPVLSVIGIELGFSGSAKSILLAGAVLLARSGCLDLHPVLSAVRASEGETMHVLGWGSGVRCSKNR